MRFVLIMFTGLMGLARSSPAPVLVLVANGSEITINLSGDTSNNRLVSVVSDAGNNNPSVFDWIGGNGANKAPRLDISGGGGGGREPGSGTGGNNNGAGNAALIDALLKRILAAAAEPNIRPPTVDREDDGDDGESRQTNAATGVTKPNEARTLSGPTESEVVTWSTKLKVKPVEEMEDI
uniref:Putative conserved secreted protein n=1 Tax=Culex tarsalis TaxID=7177 RepID=A0A1Q3FQ42_CULTA